MSGYLGHAANCKSDGTTACIVSNFAIGVVVGMGLAHFVPCTYLATKKATNKRKKWTLYYFNIPALGEPIRMLLELGGFDWEDKPVGGADGSWQKLKPTTKFGQIPLLKSSDGTEMTQTKAIIRYLGKNTKVNGCTLYPDDDMHRFQADEIIEAFEDVRLKMMPTFSIKDQAEKEAARAALYKPDGPCSELLRKIDATLGTDGHCVGGVYTIADVWTFFFLGFIRSGFWDGLPASSLAEGLYPNMDKVVHNMKNLPALKAYYGKNDSPMYASFRA